MYVTGAMQIGRLSPVIKHMCITNAEGVMLKCPVQPPDSLPASDFEPPLSHALNS